MALKFASLGFEIKSIDEETHSLKAVFSTNDVDRHGEIVDQKSWNLKDFQDNPVVLFSHDHSQPPIGRVTSLGYNGQGNLEGTVQFAAKEYPFANVIWQLYKGGFMRAFSVGFSSGKVDVENGVPILRQNTLYELSSVSVPANQMALAKSKGLDVSALEEKFVEDAAKTDEPAKALGDVCTLDDGSEGMLQQDNSGALVCLPKLAQDNNTETKEEEKGAIADELSAEQVWELKYENMDKVCELWSALWTVYMDENTSVDSFNALVTEVAQLMLKVANGADVTENTLSETLKKHMTDESVKTFIQEMGKRLGTTTEKVEEVVPVVEEKKVEEKTEDKTVSTNSTALSIKVETPAVRIVVPVKGKNKAALINKAVRALLAEKRK